MLWVVADKPESLTASYLELARVLNLAEKDAQESEVVIGAVKEWLRTATKYLLILDNADDLKLAQEFLPPMMGGHVLVTTRAQAMGRFAKRLEVEVLPVEQGVEFLLKRAGMEQTSEEEQKAARALCEALGGLPLALDQAGAYIEETQSSLVEYEQFYQQQRVALLKERGGLVSDHPEAVATTWSLSFQRVEQKNPAAADVLRMCAFLAADVIPESILTQGGEELGPRVQELATDPLALKKAIAVLGGYSLLKRDATSRTVSVHRLVQAVLRDQMDEGDQRQWAKRTVRALDACFPNGEHESWVQCEYLVPHALECAQWIESWDVQNQEAAFLLTRVGWYLYQRARYSEAERLDGQALRILKEVSGADATETATVLNNLALLYQAQGKYSDAEPLLKRVVPIYEKQLGAMHPWTATALNNLGELYRAQGKYVEAEPLHKRALAIREQQLGAMHPDVAQSLNNLGKLYRAQGKYSEAEPLYTQALAIYQKELGKDRPFVATLMNNLAELYREQGKYSEAEPLLKRVVPIYEQQLGETHPHVATALNNLANLYQAQGKYVEAEPLYSRALAIDETVSGQEHLDVATDLNNLASLYYAQGKYVEAEPLYERSLRIRERQLGKTHPSVATGLNNLAGLYRAQGKDAEAEPLYQRALAIREQVLGAMHPETAQSWWWLAVLAEEQGKAREALRLYWQALGVYEQALGREHPTTQNVRGFYERCLKRVQGMQEPGKQ